MGKKEVAKKKIIVAVASFHCYTYSGLHNFLLHEKRLICSTFTINVVTMAKNILMVEKIPYCAGRVALDKPNFFDRKTTNNFDRKITNRFSVDVGEKINK